MNRLRRLRGWESALIEFVASRRAVPFAWGRNDCALFAADAVQAITGVDLAAAFRGTYQTDIRAGIVLRRIGEGNLVATVDAMLPRHDAVALALRGDVVAGLDDSGFDALGIVAPDGIHGIALRPEGLAAFDLCHARIAWRVG